MQGGPLVHKAPQRRRRSSLSHVRSGILLYERQTVKCTRLCLGHRQREGRTSLLRILQSIDLKHTKAKDKDIVDLVHIIKTWGECRYNSTHSWRRHEMDLSDHAPAALCPAQNFRYSLNMRMCGRVHSEIIKNKLRIRHTLKQSIHLPFSILYRFVPKIHTS